MHYQVSQGLRGCYLPDYQECFATLDGARAYIKAEMENILEMGWLADTVDDGLVYGPSESNFCYGAFIATCNCEEYPEVILLTAYCDGKIQSTETMDMGMELPDVVAMIGAEMAADAARGTYQDVSMVASQAEDFPYNTEVIIAAVFYLDTDGVRQTVTYTAQWTVVDA